METVITGHYTTPHCYFGISPVLLDLITNTIDSKILKPFPIQKAKSTELEIWLDVEVKTNNYYVRKLSKTLRGKYLSFEIKLPYNIIVTEKNMDITLFITYFMQALAEALLPYQNATKDIYKEVTDFLIQQTSGTNKYDYKPGKDLIDWEKVLPGILNNKTGKIVE